MLSAPGKSGRLHPNDAAALAILGTLEESRGNFGKAEADYRKSLQIQPQAADRGEQSRLSHALNGENVDVALTLAQTARQGMPNSPNTADTLAWAYYYKGTYGFARDLLEDAVKTEPNDACNAISPGNGVQQTSGQEQRGDSPEEGGISGARLANRQGRESCAARTWLEVTLRFN